jgi:hypothetical protein
MMYLLLRVWVAFDQERESSPPLLSRRDSRHFIKRSREVLRNIKPIFIENSRIPALLSRFAPLNISAITIIILVFSRGTMSETTKRHETIHVQQTLELFVLPMIIAYLGSYLWNFWRFRSDWKGQTNQRGFKYSSLGNKAYHQIIFEREAYDNEHDPEYLQTRKRYNYFFGNK